MNQDLDRLQISQAEPPVILSQSSNPKKRKMQGTLVNPYLKKRKVQGAKFQNLDDDDEDEILINKWIIYALFDFLNT